MDRNNENDKMQIQDLLKSQKYSMKKKEMFQKAKRLYCGSETTPPPAGENINCKPGKTKDLNLTPFS